MKCATSLKNSFAYCADTNAERFTTNVFVFFCNLKRKLGFVSNGWLLYSIDINILFFVLIPSNSELLPKLPTDGKFCGMLLVSAYRVIRRDVPLFFNI